MAKKKYYAVKVGTKPGIYETWAECEAAEYTWDEVETAQHTWESFQLAVPPEE